MSSLTTTNALEALFETSNSPTEYAAGFLARMAELMKTIDIEAIAKVVDAIDRAQQENRAIFCIGNGGSAAVASHIVNDLCPNSLVKGKRGFRAFSLTDNVESLTAIANDSGFENIFSAQLECDMQPGDVVMAFSVSGNSENIIRAIDYANENGATTIGLVGFEGGRLVEKCKHVVLVPTTHDEYGPVEDIFSNIGHIITGYLAMKHGRKLSH